MRFISRICTAAKSVGWGFHLLSTLLVLGLFLALPISYFGNSNVWIGIVMVPFATLFYGSKRVNITYVFTTCLFTFLAAAYPLKVFYVIAAMFFGLLLVEVTIGRVNPLILFLFFFMLPIFHQFAGIFGFPIRMMLSEWAGSILRWVGMEVEVLGSSMVLRGVEFSVDEACMGLNMLSFSMLMTVVIIAHHCRRLRVILSMSKLMMCFSLAFTLVLLANFLRIVILVVLFIPPSNPLHEFIGLGCMILYTIVPMYFVIKVATARWGTPAKFEFEARQPTPAILFSFLVFGVVFVVVGFRQPRILELGVNQPSITYSQKKGEWIKPDVFRISNPDMLLYVKPIPTFYSGEHTPAYCWRGSGYKISGLSEHRVGTTAVYLGRLEKSGSVLHTAWWYTDGISSTVGQFTWRREMFRTGRPFALVNVTCSSRELLIARVEEILAKRRLSIAYSR